MDLKEMIDGLVEQRVKTILETMLDGSGDGGIATVAANYSKGNRSRVARETMEREIASTDEPTVRRRRRVRRPRVGYVVVTNRLGRYTKPDDLFDTAATTFAAIAKSKVPLSNLDLERVTGLKRKTVESCIWYLRRHDATGALVKDGKGLVTAQPLSGE